MPPLGCSDHNMINLVPSYVQKEKSVKPVEKTIKCWNPESTEQLQGCLACTDWTVFKEACPDLNELATTITDYISFCTDNCMPNKTITVYSNNKPWVTKELRIKVDHP